MTGSLQNYARRNRIPIDVVEYDFEVMATDDANKFNSQPEEGMYVRGAFIEGGTWDYAAMMIAESRPKVLYATCPIIHYKPTVISKLPEYPHYSCPMYRTDDRRGTLATTGHSTNFVMKLRLPSNMPSEHWIKRGTALLTTLRG